MYESWGDIFKEFSEVTKMPHESISNWKPCVRPYYDEIPDTIVIWLKNGGTILYTPPKTVFEVGKCYEHTDGTKMRIIAEVNTHFYGHGLLGETDSAEYIIVGNEEDHAINWEECEDFGKKGTDKS